MDIKGLALLIFALLAVSAAVGATASRRHGSSSTKGAFKIALLTFIALFVGVAGLIYISAVFFLC